jgi:hypothetical protein
MQITLRFFLEDSLSFSLEDLMGYIAIRSLFFISIHKVEIGQKYYDQALARLIDFTAKECTGVQI